jgi:hypothetical protein
MGLQMANNKELEVGLGAMAAEFHLPGGGRKKLARLVAAHLEWFEAAEQRGMVWQDMVRALAAAGITTADSKPLSVGTLSSTVWRKRAETKRGPVIDGRGLTRPGQPEEVRKREMPPRDTKPTVPRGQRQENKSKTVAERARKIRPQAPAAKGNAAQHGDILEFMDRARTVRRRSE